nr:MAG TPA: cell cycle control protein [Caudoviricetes sp.]
MRLSSGTQCGKNCGQWRICQASRPTREDHYKSV